MRKIELYSWVLCLSLAVSLVLAHEGQHPEKALKGKQKLKMDKAIKEIGVDYQKNIEPIFKVSCFDCHSSSTSYPWYHGIPGARSMLEKDVSTGREHIEMSGGFPFKGHHTPEQALTGIAYDIDKGKMPPLKYRMMHWKSGLTEKQKQEVEGWVERSLHKLKKIK